MYISIIFYNQHTLWKGHGTNLGSFTHMDDWAWCHISLQTKQPNDSLLVYPQKGLWVCPRHSLQRGHPPPPITGYPPTFRILLTSTPPPQNFTESQPFCNCTQIHYFRLYKTMLWPSDEAYWGVLVFRYKTRP